MRSTSLIGAVLLLVSSLGLGCAFGEIRPDDLFKRKFSLEDKHKEYTDSVRWSKFAEASGHMMQQDRHSFLAQMPQFNQLRFTDWSAEPFELDDEEKAAATIYVTYLGYSMSYPVEVEIEEIQRWTREGTGNRWTVVSTFEHLDKLVGR